MNAAKFFTFIGLAILISSFFSSLLSIAYPSPVYNYNSCSGPDYDLSSCYSIIDQSCGKDSVYNNGTCFNSHSSDAPYNSCINNKNDAYTSCINKSSGGSSNHNLISYSILAVVGLLLMIFGFWSMARPTFGAGYLTGGLFTFFYASIYVSSYGTYLSKSIGAIDYVQLGLTLVGIIILSVCSVKVLDNEK